jgi:hypothetical protein
MCQSTTNVPNERHQISGAHSVSSFHADHRTRLCTPGAGLCTAPEAGAALPLAAKPVAAERGPADDDEELVDEIAQDAQRENADEHGVRRQELT